MEVRFIFKSSSGKPRTHSRRLPVVVGRSDAADVKLRIPSDSVSRRHCEFFLDDAGRVCIRDLGSTNGTLVDGSPVEPQAALRLGPGSVVKLGTVGFRVEFSAGAAPEGDSDTIPIESAEPATTGGSTDATEPLPPGAAVAAEPSGEQVGEAATAGAAGEPAEDAEPADSGAGFAFLGGAGEAAPEDEPAWPGGENSPAGNDDEGFGDFLKGLS